MNQDEKKIASLNILDIPTGLPNYGNTCFVNVILQSLANCNYVMSCIEEDYFRLYSILKELGRFSGKENPVELREKFHTLGCEESEKHRCLLCSLEKSLLLIRQPPNAQLIVQNVQNFVDLFPSFPMKVFQKGRQEDCHELFMNILFAFELFHENNSSNSNTLYSANSLTNQSMYSLEVETLQDNLRRTSKSTYLLHPRLEKLFHGRLLQEIECSTCHSLSAHQESFIDLSLNIQTSSTLESAIQDYFKTIHFTGKNQYDCLSCKKKTDANQYLSFVFLPKVLCVQLKRFQFQDNSQLTKIQHFVSFPLELDCDLLQNPFYVEKKREERRKSGKDQEFYELKAVVVHKGESLNNGHYVCYLQREGNAWYLADDTKVFRVSIDEVLQANAYLLFYEKSDAKTIEVNHSRNIPPREVSVGQMNISEKKMTITIEPTKTNPYLVEDSSVAEQSVPSSSTPRRSISSFTFEEKLTLWKEKSEAQQQQPRSPGSHLSKNYQGPGFFQHSYSNSSQNGRVSLPHQFTRYKQHEDSVKRLSQSQSPESTTPSPANYTEQNKLLTAATSKDENISQTLKNDDISVKKKSISFKIPIIPSASSDIDGPIEMYTRQDKHIDLTESVDEMLEESAPSSHSIDLLDQSMNALRPIRSMSASMDVDPRNENLPQITTEMLNETMKSVDYSLSHTHPEPIDVDEAEEEVFSPNVTSRQMKKRKRDTYNNELEKGLLEFQHLQEEKKQSNNSLSSGPGNGNCIDLTRNKNGSRDNNNDDDDDDSDDDNPNGKRQKRNNSSAISIVSFFTSFPKKIFKGLRTMFTGSKKKDWKKDSSHVKKNSEQHRKAVLKTFKEGKIKMATPYLNQKDLEDAEMMTITAEENSSSSFQMNGNMNVEKGHNNNQTNKINDTIILSNEEEMSINPADLDFDIERSLVDQGIGRKSVGFEETAEERRIRRAPIELPSRYSRRQLSQRPSFHQTWQSTKETFRNLFFEDDDEEEGNNNEGRRSSEKMKKERNPTQQQDEEEEDDQDQFDQSNNNSQSSIWLYMKFLVALCTALSIDRILSLRNILCLLSLPS